MSTDQQLFERLRIIEKNIHDDVYTPELKQELFDVLESYVTGTSTVDPEALRLLMMGWMVNSMIAHQAEN